MHIGKEPSLKGRGRLCTLDLLIISLAAFYLADNVVFFTKQANLMRRSPVLSLPCLRLWHVPHPYQDSKARENSN
jgi:hypothetical protein